MLRHLTLTTLLVLIIVLIKLTKQDFFVESEKPVATTKKTTPSYYYTVNNKMTKYLKAAAAWKNKTIRTGNMTTNKKASNKSLTAPPEKLFHEYLRCRQLHSLDRLSESNSCPHDFEAHTDVCWPATTRGTYASTVIEYDYGLNPFYDRVRYGVENCTLQRFCRNNGTWAATVSPDIQCETCDGIGRPVKFNSISIMIESISLSLSLISLTIAILCMINVKYVSYFYVKLFRLNLSDANRYGGLARRLNKPRFSVIPQDMPRLCRCIYTFRRLHLPRNLLHMHLFLAFILRSIVKLVFINTIVGGYTYTMITYTYDKCGNIEILSKSSRLFHIVGCRLLASLFWYTDAVSQTFIFCEAMFLFTALTSHLFRDRGCALFVLWGWLSPMVWLSMWIASHIITDNLKSRSTCWLEADHTTYYYYFFYVPYAFYLLINFGIFMYLVRLLYSKYRSNNVQTARSGNRHLIKSILVLIPLFGLHSLFVIWVFYHKNEGHTVWYYIAVIFKAVFGDLQGFFTSLIYFYFNTEIRSEVIRQVHRTLLSNDTLRRNSGGETLSTRLSIFRKSLSFRRRSSNKNHADKPSRRQVPWSSPEVPDPQSSCWRKFLVVLCPCFFESDEQRKQIEDSQRPMSIAEVHVQSEPLPTMQLTVKTEGDNEHKESQLNVQPCLSNGSIYVNALTDDKNVIQHEDVHNQLLVDSDGIAHCHLRSTSERTAMILNEMPMHHTRSRHDESSV